MKCFQVTIQELSPLLINRFKEQDEIKTAITTNATSNGKYGTPREQANLAAYVDEKEYLWVPSTWIMGSLATVASDYKLKGSGSGKRTLKSVIAGAVGVTEERLYFDEKYKLKHSEVDSRPAVVNRARIMRHRPRLEQWTITFFVEVNENIVDPKELKKVMEDAGVRVGIGDFRPPKGGPFGKFHIILWKEVESRSSSSKAPRKVVVAK